LPEDDLGEDSFFPYLLPFVHVPTFCVEALAENAFAAFRSDPDYASLAIEFALQAGALYPDPAVAFVLIE
jgi:hypothetical protein